MLFGDRKAAWEPGALPNRRVRHWWDGQRIAGRWFARHRWPLEVITTAVRWYLRSRLSAADVRDLLAERRIDVSARTVLAWAHTFGPLLAAEGRRHARPVGSRWWADETSVRGGREVGLPLPGHR
jgi:transposase-like protein